MKKFIRIKGAREHNLKNLDISIPRNKFVVISGVSGSGKSSLAFDTIYAEGQRRYVESLSSYARQFLGQMKKPRVDTISGIPPAVAIQQKGPGYNPRSTVGTLTEINDYLRLLFARAGIPHCPNCGRKIKSQSVNEIVRRIINRGQGKEITILVPVVRGRKGKYKELFERLRSEGFITVEVDGKKYSLEEKIELDARRKHHISVEVDEVEITGSESNRERISDSVEIALKKGEGVIQVKGLNSEPETFSKHYACPVCGLSVGDIQPRNFSFNSPYGACPACSGLGIKMEIDESLVVPDDSLSLNQGAIKPWSNPITTRRQKWKGAARRYKYQMITTLSRELNFSMDAPFKELPQKIRKILLYGSQREFDFVLTKGGRTYKKTREFEGSVQELSRRYRQTDSNYVRDKIQQEYMREMVCPECGGRRLRKESLSVIIGGKNIAELTEMPVGSLRDFLKSIKFSKQDIPAAEKIMEELISRLGFLINVGVDYVSLDRRANSLSSGEAERIKLATQIGSSLVGVVYILDEPTVGLHARDTKRLLDSLKELKEIGNTLLVVEHDPQTIEQAEYVIDLGPGAGVHGGNIVFSGQKQEFIKNRKSLTSMYFTGKKEVPVPEKRRDPSNKKIAVKGAKQFNLKNINAEFPVGLLNCVTGVSGSGKSTLVEEVLFKGTKNKLSSSSDEIPGEHREIKGIENIKKVINIDQTPIGRTPRSNPATYTKVFTPIRELFASLPASRARGYSKGRFSFNVKEGTCQRCKGQGFIKIEMHFLPDIYVPCESCSGRKYTDATLDIKYKGKDVHEVLEMTVEEANEFFSRIPSIKRILDTLMDVGLGYIKLGQSSTTLSGGEAQRIKLARELAKKTSGKTLYILDEPTTGLHPDDIKHLLNVLHSLVDKGNTVVIIEHNMDVIKNADWIIDLGPEGGEKGGEIVICGNPSKLVKYPQSYTGKYLKKYLKQNN
ncbi:MAG: excinuclease ABC subunit UvrA [Elusimicrobiota bacterium]